ncbi:unnamed protein product [Tilletia controversa]|uniref:RING-type domain-containing protein n=3 Tax=Tilletia TaxID=13289 RepID=A0A8X7MSG2_9BASI|nr:hypothetical protein CF336_g8548 [Tilletia laevis]KAE8185565.1 hypothetical protein CF328_g7508 [Tilletia controversa]KAE8240924.1 hypothetical protein A4X03_0g8258 [Tilletia caries]KAE8246375.1 hypothetical protein A4X06_0g5044 [Tilletia controversa]CAD6885482.1 unnamed protein product [Tilletia caries]
MKFGKTYISTLASSSFPEDWKAGAVDYRHLKKLINGVVQELESLGLGADVLKDLLVPPAEELSNTAHSDGTTTTPSNILITSDNGDDDDDHSDEDHLRTKVYHEETPAEQWIDTLPSAATRRQRSCTPSSHSSEHDDSATESASHENIEAPTAFNGKRRKSVHKTPADFKRTHDTLMRRAESGSSHASSSGGSGSGSVGSGSASVAGSSADWAKPKKAFHTGEDGKSHIDSEGRRWLNGKEGRRARAEYDLGGTPEHPVPRIRLFIESPIRSDDEDEDDSDDTDADADDDFDPSESPSTNQPDQTSSLSSLQSSTSAAGTVRAAEDDSPVTLRGRASDSPASTFTGRTPVLTTAGVVLDEMALADAAEAEAAGKLEPLPEAALDSYLHPDHAYEQRGRDGKRNSDQKKKRQRRHLSPSTGRRFRRREININLTADTEFLERLTGALQRLSHIQQQQRTQFVAATENLCSSIARVASPYATPTDMYVWREIFALWVDSQIFESSREKDRGELTVEESEARLKRFAEELAKRGWIARENNLSEDAEEVAAVEAEQQGQGQGQGKKKGGKGSAGLFRLGHPHSSHKGTDTAKEAETITLPDGTVAHVPHHDRTQSALDDFLKLNVELLDVKKFQAVNIEAARKILKKHDKRTALTAASDLRAFMALQEREREQLARLTAGGGGSPSSTWNGADRLNLMEVNGGIAPKPLRDAPHALPLAKFDSLSLLSSSSNSRELTTTHPSLAALLPTSATGLMGGSLPHILLSLLTTTLLPILPSIDESSCVICTSVAWRPVRLICGHLFCIRCLVKLQRQHRDDCPLCRAPLAVKNANGSNLDEAMGNLLKTYFPEEVKVKQKENDKEVQAEEEKEMGLEKMHCVIC